jgi:methylmalonyl-CoA/ethylmalonyl-CoA epimerase
VGQYWSLNKKLKYMKPDFIDHIGIAVKSLEESIPLFEKLLGTACYSIEEVADQHVKTAFFQVGQTKIELLESTDPEGPIGSFIEKRGEGIHHIAFATENVDQALLDAKENGIRLIDRISRKGAEGMNIGFLNPRSTNGVLIEFCSKD